jgi:hypothetical protein
MNNIKWMNTTCLQPRVMWQCKFYLFTTKRFVSIETLPVHLQKVCSHWELKQYEAAHFQYHFTLFLIWIQSIKLCFKSFLPLEEENCILSPSPHELTSSIFSTSRIHLQLLHIYFAMAKRKFTRMVTPNTLEIMIEYTLISNILNRICEMTKNLWNIQEIPPS